MELGVVTFLLDGLRLLAGEVHMIPGIHGHIDNLRLELESIYMILKEAYTRQQSNTSVSPWIRAVGQLAFEIEDVIDKYKLYAARQSSKPLRNLISFHSIGKQIEDIQKRINDIRQIRERYREIISSQAQASSTTTSIETRQFPKVACLFLDDPQIVGFVEPANQLVSWIGEPISMTAVISVVGMGGTQRSRIYPSRFGKLVNLETLDLKQTYITELSSEILQLHRLRHLLIYRYDFLNYAAFGCVRGFSVHGRIGGLTTLQKLAFVKASMETRIIDDLQNLTQLRKLGIVEVRRESGEYLCLSIEKMQSLHTLSITSESMEEYLDLNTLSHPPRHLQRLYLKGQLERMPRWISELQNLVRIRLKWSKLSDDPTEALQDLPTLLDLQLLDAYTGSELLFSEGKFKKLKILEFNQLRNLRKVMMDNGTLPQLQKLIIRSCPLLTAVPIGIDNLTQLEELYLHDMTETFINGIQKNGGKYRRMVNHIPIIHSYSLGSFTNLS
ncbi:PREDICTED: disease resistance protein RPM1-like [Nelumbo nucifera]|uniref:Disease resistance protein RPM1-like n=1 Tax=Nelumbo nucifera TaxID=4432 RepID=A0A1U7YT97_NELNU|nr:PREDICTED: disease resistance protein RPM1-like [Nelumbo nucifera]